MNYYYPSSAPLPVPEKPGVYAHPLGAASIDPRSLGPAGLPSAQVPASLGYAQQGSPTPSQQLAAQQAYSAAQQAYAQQIAYGAPQPPAAVSSPYHYGPPAGSLYGQPGLPYHVASLASPSSPYLSSQTPTMGAVRVPVATTATAAYQTTASPMFGYSGFGGQPMYAPSMYGASVMTPQQSAGLYPSPVGMSPAPGYAGGQVAPASAMYSSRPRPSN